MEALSVKVALVAGATRGAGRGIAVEWVPPEPPPSYRTNDPVGRSELNARETPEVQDAGKPADTTGYR